MNKNVCYIFGAGDLYISNLKIPSDALVIAADGGLHHTKKLGVNPDIILGDFDSYDINDVDKECIVLPREKDYTDTFIAAEYAYKAGIKKIEVFGGLGGKRIEHTIANLQMLEYFSKRSCEIILHGDNEYITAITGPAVKHYSSKEKGYISVFAVGGNATGLYISGLKYKLDNQTLTTEFPLGVSNEFCGKESRISLSSGTLLIVWQKFIYN